MRARTHSRLRSCWALGIASVLHHPIHACANSASKVCAKQYIFQLSTRTMLRLAA